MGSVGPALDSASQSRSWSPAHPPPHLRPGASGSLGGAGHRANPQAVRMAPGADNTWQRSQPFSSDALGRQLVLLSLFYSIKAINNLNRVKSFLSVLVSGGQAVVQEE